MSPPVDRDLYCYRPLPSPRATRLLKLEPSCDFNSALTCSLEEVPLHQLGVASNPYEALSYVWGPGYGKGFVKCEGKILHITPNCETALRHIRYRDKTRVLWVDSICIDQSSNKPRSIQERNEQVKNMADIYSGAKCVLTWLGEFDHKATVILGFLSSIGKYWRLKQSKNKAKGLIGDIGLWYHGGRLAKVNGNNLNSLGEHSPLRVIYHSPWFSRTWTVQEVAFAGECSVMCGGPRGYASSSWTDLMDTLSYIVLTHQELIRNPLVSVNWVQSIGARDLLRKFVKNRDNLSTPAKGYFEILAPLLPMIAFNNATIPQDKAYGIYSILRTFEITLPDPDYSKSKEKIFEELAFAIMHQTRSLQLLRFACSNNKTRGLPSWVPDWEDKDHLNYGLDAHSVYTRTAIVDQPQENHLRISGREVDTVKVRAASDFSTLSVSSLRLGHAMIFSNSAKAGILGLVSEIPLLKNWLELAQDLKSYPTKESVSAALLETLTQSSMATPEHLKAFEFLCSALQYPESCTYDLSTPAKHVHTLELEDQLGKDYWTDDIRTRVTIAAAIGCPEMVSRDGKFLPESEEPQNLWNKISSLALGRAFFITHTDYLGTGHHEVREGDRIVLFQGAKEPIILRLVEGGFYELIGPAYVCGLDCVNAEGDGGDKDLEKFILI